jgi:hypothetical protein
LRYAPKNRRQGIKNQYSNVNQQTAMKRGELAQAQDNNAALFALLWNDGQMLITPPENKNLSSSSLIFRLLLSLTAPRP